MLFRYSFKLKISLIEMISNFQFHCFFYVFFIQTRVYVSCFYYFLLLLACMAFKKKELLNQLMEY